MNIYLLIKENNIYQIHHDNPIHDKSMLLKSNGKGVFGRTYFAIRQNLSHTGCLSHPRKIVMHAIYKYTISHVL